MSLYKPVDRIIISELTYTPLYSKMLIQEQEPRYRRDHRAMRSKFRYLSKFTAASRGFHCDSNAFELNNNINLVKISMLNTSIYCL